MKCVHCGYTTGYYWDASETYVKSDEERGEFYTLPIKLERDERYSFTPETIELFGCPCCSKTFIGKR